MVDSATARTTMVDNQIRTVDVSDYALLQAMEAVPREEFLPGSLKPLAYLDRHLPIPTAQGRAERHQLAPGPFAKLVQLAEISSSDIILVVGCPTGYSAAILSHLANSVVAVEEDIDLIECSSQSLADQGIDNAAIVSGPLIEGWSKEGPYDAIVVAGAVDALPGELCDQLKEGGRLVVIEGRGNSAQARLYRRAGDLVSSSFGFNAAAPVLPGFEVAAEFVF